MARRLAPLVIVVLAGCATDYESRIPRIENYMPRPVARPDAATSPLDAGRDTVPADVAAPRKGPLTLQSCVRIALEENPALRAAREGVAIAHDSVGIARAPYYPTLGLNAAYRRFESHIFLPEGVGGANPPTSLGPTDDWSTGLRARYLLFDSGARAAQMRAALSRRDVAEEEAAAIRQDIALAVHQDFYSLLSAMEAKSAAKENLLRAEEHLRLTREHLAAGAVPQADVIRAQVEVADARLNSVRAESAVRLAQGKLNTTMGLPVETDIETDTRADDMVSPEDIKVAESLERAVHARPELRAALRRIAGARNAVDAAKSAYGPRITTDAGYGYRDSEFLPEDKDWSVGVGLELPLFDGFARSHSLSKAKREVSREEAEARRMVLKVREEVWSAHLKLKEAYEAAQAAEALVRDAGESMRVTQERYKAGAATTSDLLDAQTTLARAEFISVDSRWNYHMATASLRRAIGEIADTETPSRP